MRKNIWTISMVVLAMLFIATAGAETDQSWGPELGSTIPDQLETQDQEGNPQSFETLVGEKGLAIVFLRSLDWCRFCKGQAKELDQRVSDFARRGVQLVALSYDPLETLKSFHLEHAPQLTFLSDPQSRVIKAFGILNQREKPGSRGFGIPNPGIIIVDSRGIIRLKFAEESYRKRPQIDDVLAAIDQLDL